MRFAMLNKTLIALSAAALFGSVSASLAYEAPENKIGDRFPALEQAYQPIAAAKVAVRKVMHRQAMYGYEAPENKIGDRFPFLEQTYAAKSVSNGHVMAVRINKHAKKV